MRSMRSVAMVSRGLAFRLEAVLFLDPANAKGVALVPPLLAGPLGEAVFPLLTPIADRFEIVPVRHSDADAVGPAGALDAEIAGHRRGQRDHASCGAVVTFGIGGGAMRGEDDGVVGRLRGTRERVHAVSVLGEWGCVSAPRPMMRSNASLASGRLRNPARQETYLIVNTTSPVPTLPAASRTRSISTCVPGLSASVVKRNDSFFESKRPSSGNRLSHLRPSREKDAAVSRTIASVASATTTALPPSTVTTFAAIVGASWATTTGSLTRSAVSACPSGLSGRSLATTFTR